MVRFMLNIAYIWTAHFTIPYRNRMCTLDVCREIQNLFWCSLGRASIKKNSTSSGTCPLKGHWTGDFGYLFFPYICWANLENMDATKKLPPIPYARWSPRVTVQFLALLSSFLELHTCPLSLRPNPTLNPYRIQKVLRQGQGMTIQKNSYFLHFV